MHIVILGGYGFTGRALAVHLLEETQARLLLVGRNAGRAQQAAGELNGRFPGGRVASAVADAADETGLAWAFRGADLVVNASATASLAPRIYRAALTAGCDLLDVQYHLDQLASVKALAGEIGESGRCFIAEAGFHPGLPLAAVRHGARGFDRLDRAVVGSVLNPEGGLPYSSAVDELVEMFRDYRARVLQGGRWVDWRTTGWRPKPMEFGEPFGRRSCYPMDLVEMEALPALFPSLRDAGFYVAGFNPVTDWVVTPLIMGLLKFRAPRLDRFSGRLLCWASRAFSRAPYGVVLKAETTGDRGGQPCRRELLFSHPDGYEFTVIPVTACLLQWMDGSARKPGLHLMGAVVDPGRLVRDMERMGVAVRETEAGEAR